MFLVLMKGWRNEGKKAFYCLYVLLFFTFSFIGVQKIIAEEVEFSGTTAPLNVNVREAKSLNANIVDVIPEIQKYLLKDGSMVKRLKITGQEI